MTVYNGAAFLAETIQSVLQQTFGDYVFLIIDNASTDNGPEIVKSFHDARIQLVQLPQNIGQIPALNKGLDMVKTPLIARMDADDVLLPGRFQQQVEYLDQHPEIGICGTFATTFGTVKSVAYTYACSPADVAVQLLFECALAHPSVMMRTALLNQYHLRYDETLGHSEDWELWQRAARFFSIANIPHFLLKYRLHEKNESRRISHRQQTTAERLDTASLTHLHLEQHPLRGVHRDVSYATFNARNRGPQFLDHVYTWFQTLLIANAQYHVYDQKALRLFLKRRLFVVLHANTHSRKKVLNLFFKEKLWLTEGFYRAIKFCVKVLLSPILRHKHQETHER